MNMFKNIWTGRKYGVCLKLNTFKRKIQEKGEEMNELTFRLIYLFVGIALSAWVLWRLHRSGQMLLAEKLHGNPELVKLMSHAVSAGCVLVMFGYIAISGWPISGLS